MTGKEKFYIKLSLPLSDYHHLIKSMEAEI